jgi:hypothetical protein
VQRQTILLIWLGGAVLAVLLYVVGPDRFLAVSLDAFESVDAAVRNLVAAIGAEAAAVIRPAAIAVYAVFVVLALAAGRRGWRAGWALVLVTLAEALLVWRPAWSSPAPVGRWFSALILALVGAVVMTHRLLGTPPPPRGPWPPVRPPA